MKLREGEDIKVALARFKKECVENGVFENIRNHDFFQTKAERRREKLKRSLRRKER